MLKKCTLLSLILFCLWQNMWAISITYPDSNYASLQAAVDALKNSADSSKTLVLASGNFEEQLSVSDNITLKSSSTIASILSGNGNIDPILSVSGNVFVNLQNIFFASANVGVRFTGLAQGNINNCIFFMGNTHSAVICESTSSVNIFNNTFYKNNVAIQASEISGIQNNIFCQSGNSLVGLLSDNGITHNLFMEENGGNILGSDNIEGSASFVSANLLDFHLLSGSLAIDAGTLVVGNDILDNSTPDLGAYGGPFADVIPQDVRSFVASSTSPSSANLSLSLSWTSNLDYQVKGYLLYYDTDESTAPYTGNIANMNASPIDCGLVTSTQLNNLDISVSIESAPSITAIIPRNSSLIVQWNSSSNTTGYVLQYRVDGSGSAYSEIEVGLVNTATITGLSNHVVYEIRVLGLSRPSIYFALAAYYSSNVSVSQIGYLENSKATYQAPTAILSTPSSSQTGTPEITLGFPLLPNNGGGCLLKGGL